MKINASHIYMYIITSNIKYRKVINPHWYTNSHCVFSKYICVFSTQVSYFSMNYFENDKCIFVYVLIQVITGENYVLILISKWNKKSNQLEMFSCTDFHKKNKNIYDNISDIVINRVISYSYMHELWWIIKYN
jgi:hypothetical protein